MRFLLKTISYNSKYTLVFSVAKYSCLTSLVFMVIAGRLAVASNNIPICQQLWRALGGDFADWRARCIDGDQESHSQSCIAEKEYFEVRRLAHRQMCFYEGE